MIDEAAGFLVTMVPIPEFSWKAVIAGFVFFRVLDVLKPWPIRRFERLPSGWGVVTDDLVAGVFAAVAMYALRRAGVFR